MNTNKNELVIADLNTLNVFTFVDAESDGQAELLQAQEYLADQAKSLECLIADCQRQEFRKQWEDSLQTIRETEYRIVPLEDFYTAERKKMLADPLKRITEEQYWDALEVLPPLHYERLDGGCERFCMREFFTATYTTQYFHSKEGCFCRMVDFADQTTWIMHDEVRKAV
ncbi:MAG: hypothetical protein IKO93_08560 [Lentisphaeria bacterium]|nr:hypothetical protein [Lentisphaeria bacterium]